ncbi:amino acid permease-domain-containing protein [Mycena sp. CBHHK59/15]|nr:amino acid permease-domain-containing protein [Mycena sp. CBHHK59/15]
MAKIALAIGCIIGGLVIEDPCTTALGFAIGRPNPGAFSPFIETGDTGNFLGWFQTLLQVASLLWGFPNFNPLMSTNSRDGRDPANTYIQEAAHSDQRWHIRQSPARSPAYVPCFNSRTAHSDAGLPSRLALVQAGWSRRSVKQSGVRMREKKNTWDSNCRWFEKHQTDEDPAKHPTHTGPTMPHRASTKSKSHLWEVEWVQDMRPPTQHNVCGTQSAGCNWRSAKVLHNTLHPRLHGIESHEISRSGADDSLTSVLLPPSTRTPPPSRLCPILPAAHPSTLSETAQRLKRNPSKCALVLNVCVGRVLYLLVHSGTRSWIVTEECWPGMLVPSNDPRLLQSMGTSAYSPFVLAMTRVGVKGLPSVINAGVLTSAFSAANSLLYDASRQIYGLALRGQAPRILAKTTKGAATALNWLSNLVTDLGFCTWGTIGDGQEDMVAQDTKEHVATILTGSSRPPAYLKSHSRSVSGAWNGTARFAFGHPGMLIRFLTI